MRISLFDPLPKGLAMVGTAVLVGLSVSPAVQAEPGSGSDTVTTTQVAPPVPVPAAPGGPSDSGSGAGSANVPQLPAYTPPPVATPAYTPPPVVTPDYTPPLAPATTEAPPPPPPVVTTTVPPLPAPAIVTTTVVPAPVPPPATVPPSPASPSPQAPVTTTALPLPPTSAVTTTSAASTTATSQAPSTSSSSTTAPATPAPGFATPTSESPTTTAATTASSASVPPTTAGPASEGPGGLQTTTTSEQPSSTGSVSGSSTAFTTSEKLVTVTPPEPPQAAATDVKEALAKEPIAQPAQPASQQDTDKLYGDIGATLRHHQPGGDNNGGQSGQSGQPGQGGQHDSHEWDGHVRPFQPDWISYDRPDHRGPVMCNPYRDRDLHVSYWYQGAYYVRVIPPMENIFIDVDISVTSFTSVEYGIGSYSNVVYGVSTGYFHTWDYVPRVYVNVQVIVVVNVNLYPRPFWVNRVVDCGPDPSMHGRERFIFDNGYVVWGAGVRNTAGVLTQVNLEESATYPGTPNAGVVAGPPQVEGYQVASAPQPLTPPSAVGLTAFEVVEYAVGTVVFLGLVIGAIAYTVIRRRRNTPPPAHI